MYYMKSFKKSLALALSLALSLSLAACGGGQSGTSGSSPASTDTPAAEGTDTPAPVTDVPGLRVGIVTSSGVDDGSFGQDCYNGILEFANQHPEASYNSVKESDIGKVVQAVADVVADYDVVVMPGFQFASAGVIAAENPDKYFILVDAAPTDENGEEVELGNVYSMVFKEQESGFFAGIAAALQSKTGKVAVVNGIAYPSNVNYQYGFMSGVNYANEHYGTSAQCLELPSYAGVDVTGANVGGNYIGAFADQATGKVVGQALIDQDVDIMLVAAGDSGNGVFAAIKEASTEVYAIGCDADQYDDGETGSRNIVLTSALKVMHTNVTKQLSAIVGGTFVGKNDLLGADTDSTGYVKEAGRHQLTDDTISKLEEAYALVNDGSVVPAANFNGHTPTEFPGLK